MTPSSTLLGGLTPAAFLSTYWQKRPLLVRGALPGFTSPLSPQELAGLACEGAEARLVLERGGDYPWQLRYGPFDEEDFAALPAAHWTLLVQEVDRYVPEVARLLALFRFIPNWRIDDVMISYAPEGGGVGAHVDNYDVFLLQGLGHRRWRISNTPVAEEVLVPDLDVRILQGFEADEDWVLAPGDLLYLPPSIAHEGVALDDCMTYSIGFRAPSHAEIAEGFLAYAAEHLDPLLRYSDADLKPQLHPGEISPAALAKVRAVLRALVRDDEAIDCWFGQFMTEPKRGAYEEPLEELLTPGALVEVLEAGAALERGAPGRYAYVRHADGTTSFFASGTEHRLAADLAFAAPLLSGAEPLTRETLGPHLGHGAFAALVTELVNEGLLTLQDAP